MNIRVGDSSEGTQCPLKLLTDPVVVKYMQEAALSSISDGYT